MDRQKTAMIFAAGLGTRLRPLTDTMPKALVPVGGRPLLRRVLEKLGAQGYGHIVINVHHFASMIRDYLAENGNFGFDVDISDESRALLDTGGGILAARPFLEGCGRFLVHNVDILSDVDLGWLDREAKTKLEGGALACLLVSKRQTNRYLLFDDDMRLLGWTDLRTGEVRGPHEGLRPGDCRMFAFSGIHVISGNIFRVFDNQTLEGKFPIMDFYLRSCGDHPIYGIAPESLRLMDVGKIGSLPDAAAFAESLEH